MKGKWRPGSTGSWHQRLAPGGRRTCLFWTRRGRWSIAAPSTTSSGSGIRWRRRSGRSCATPWTPCWRGRDRRWRRPRRRAASWKSARPRPVKRTPPGRRRRSPITTACRGSSSETAWTVTARARARRSRCRRTTRSAGRRRRSSASSRAGSCRRGMRTRRWGTGRTTGACPSRTARTFSRGWTPGRPRATRPTRRRSGSLSRGGRSESPTRCSRRRTRSRFPRPARWSISAWRCRRTCRRTSG